MLRLSRTVIRITQPPPTEGAWSALFSNLSKSGLDNYVVKRSKRPLLEEVACSGLPCPIDILLVFPVLLAWHLVNQMERNIDKTDQIFLIFLNSRAFSNKEKRGNFELSEKSYKSNSNK